MHFWLQRQPCLPWEARVPSPLTPLRTAQRSKRRSLRRSRPYRKTDAGYEGLGVDVLEQIRMQAKRRKVGYRVGKSVNDGISANNYPAATGFSYRISVQGCN